MNKKKEITVLLISHTGNESINFKVPISLIKLGSALLLVFLTFFFAFIHSYSYKSSYMSAYKTEKTAELNQLTEANSRQIEEIKKLEVQTQKLLNQTQELVYQMTQIEKLTVEVKEILEIETVAEENSASTEQQILEEQVADAGLRLLAHRGGYREDPSILDSEEKVNVSDYFQEKVREFKNLLELAEDHQELLAHTPSIWPTTGRLTSPFGYRRSPFTRRWEFHGGVDIGASRGTKVLATANGVVVKTSYLFGWGRLIIIDHGFERQTFYAHLSRFAVAAGDKVVKGQVIGYVGNSGRSTGPHLHYEVHFEGARVNPLDYMD